MPGGVYSTRFIRGYVSTQAAGAALFYEVPAGKVAVIRSIDFLVSIPGAVLVSTGPAANMTAMCSSMGIPELQSRCIEPHQVVSAGERIGARWISGAVDVSVSGFLLNVTP